MDALANLVLMVVGALLRAFYRWIDKLPDRPPSQISTLHKIGRLTVGVSIAALILYGIGWFIWG